MGFISSFADKVLGFDPAPLPPPPAGTKISQAATTTVTVEPGDIFQNINIESPVDEFAQAQVIAAQARAADLALTTFGQAIQIAQTESIRDLLRSQAALETERFRTNVALNAASGAFTAGEGLQDELTESRERRQGQEQIILYLALGIGLLFFMGLIK